MKKPKHVEKIQTSEIIKLRITLFKNVMKNDQWVSKCLPLFGKKCESPRVQLFGNEEKNKFFKNSASQI